MPEIGDVREDGAVWSNAWDGRFRWLYRKNCEICQKEILVRKDRLERTKYCSIVCRGISDQNRVTLTCFICKKEFQRHPADLKNSKHGYYFCSRKCKEFAQSIDGGLKIIQPSHYNEGEANYRDRAFRRYGAKCHSCGYNTDDRMLDVDHIDSNRSNNDIDNLQVLCVWCHAIKTRKNWKSYKDIVKSEKL